MPRTRSAEADFAAGCVTLQIWARPGRCAMLNIKKILLPVDFPNTSLRVVHQAATLALHFHSEVVMLHVVTAQSHAAGVPEDGPELAHWDMLAEIIREAEKNQD